ncbi:DUF5979 domain-containing protein [Agromyces salentinus]|uniref:Choice-of-anchor A family protein n=1 Tax=Agromyces salentinus TaxID=269421 RepID=A0ABN2MQ72_9MICO|nr:DUF5979 domain-containing protein [Agromyces salentinus]
MRHGSLRRFVAALGVLAVAGGSALGVAASSATAEPVSSVTLPAVAPAALPAGLIGVNPFTLAGGFTVYAKDDAVLGNTEFEGSIAVGDQLRVTQTAGYQFAHVIAGTGSYVLPTIDSDPTRVLAGSYDPDPATNSGRVEITNAGATQPSQFGDLKIVDRTTPFVTFTRASWLRYALEQGTDTPPLIDARDQVHPADSVPPTSADGDGSIYTYATGEDTASIVASYVEANAQADEGEIDQCLIDVVDPDNLIGYPVEIAEDAGDRVVLGTLSPDQPNVVQYADIEGARLLQFSDGTPGPANPLVIHVEPGTTSILPPSIDPEGTYSPYVIWDLSQVSGSVTIATDGRGDGSIYAPNADLSITAQPWDGQIIANSVDITGGEVHSYLFAGALPCAAPVDAGNFSVAKALSGVEAGGLAPGTVFEVGYLALEPDGTISTGILALDPDGTPVSPEADFPFGTSIAVFEIQPDDALLPPELAWSDVSWDGETVFTIDSTHPTVSLVVTDTAAPIPAGFSVTKTLAGSGATAVPSGEEFTLEYEVDGGAPNELVVTPGETAVVDDLAAGDVVTITEVGLPEVDGIAWGTPTWTIDGEPLTPDASGAVEFTLVGGETIALDLVNQAEAVGWISVSKTVIGDGIGALPDDLEFPLVYTLDGGPEETVVVPADEVITFDELPAGTVVTVREGELPEIPGVEWGTPGWTIDGVPQTPDAEGDITFVVQPGATVALSLVNTANGIGSLSFVKTVSGAASDLVPPDTTYPIEYRVSEGPIQTADVVAGEVFEASDFPTGVDVSVREAALPEVPGVQWGEPQWSIDGTPVAPDDDGWVSFMSATGTTVALSLENIAQLAPGGFTVTKSVAGDGASAVPPETTFTIGYRVDDQPEQMLELRAGEAATVSDLPPGAVVTFAEPVIPEVPGVTWGEPVWQVDGVEVSEPSVTIGAGRVVSVALVNTADSAAGVSVLPSAGADTGLPLTAAVILALLGAGVLVVASRRRTARP